MNGRKAPFREAHRWSARKSISPNDRTAALAALALVAPSPAALAQGNGGDRCHKLQQMYQQELDSADSLKGKAAQQAVKSGSETLSQFGIQLDGGTSGDAQQAIQKGALAATSPQMQGAIIIQLLSANAHLQELAWRGCKPPS